MAQPTPRSPAFQAVMTSMEWAAILAFLVCSVWIGSQVARAFDSFGAWALLVLAVLPLAYIAADLFTGFGHFFADNFASVDTPIIGHALVFRFRQHHDFPTIICGLSFRELNGGLALVTMPAILPTAAWMPIADTAWGLGAGVFVWATCLFSALTNQVHRWAHDGRCPAWVKPLQRTRLVLSPAHHAKHHHAPYHLHFCITHGWLNVALDRSGVWHRLADLLVMLGVPQAEESVMGRHRSRELSEAIAAK